MSRSRKQPLDYLGWWMEAGLPLGVRSSEPTTTELESHVFGLPSDWIYDIRYELLIILCPPPEFWDTRHKLLCPLVHT
ncbi:DENN domain-containing protein 5B-like protein [Cricetulus griseus]|nr:DENN domain-containing protein 5B-like protein [Cricetulus griseus]